MASEGLDEACLLGANSGHFIHQLLLAAVDCDTRRRNRRTSRTIRRNRRTTRTRRTATTRTTTRGGRPYSKRERTSSPLISQNKQFKEMLHVADILRVNDSKSGNAR
jgi:hypothetical protein